jgi:hypothetical protein
VSQDDSFVSGPASPGVSFGAIEFAVHAQTSLALTCGVRKLDSCGEAVFVDESAEPIAALNASRG